MTAPQPGRLDLSLSFDGARTRPERALATPPLQISRARYDDPADPARLYLTLLHLGGVLAGDQYALRCALGSGARATLTSASATQIYAMPRGEACQTTHLQLAPGADLDWQPGAQILFADSSYRQQTRVDLAPGARLALAEILVSGRLAHGERWRFADYTSLFEVYDAQGELLAAERISLNPARRHPARPGIMGDHAVLGTLWLLGDQIAGEPIARLLSRMQPQLSAAVLPAGCGVAIRVMACGLAAAQTALAACRQTLAAASL